MRFPLAFNFRARCLAATAAVCVSASACSVERNHPLTGLTAEPALHRPGTAIALFDKCPVSSAEEVPPILLAAVVPLVADFAIRGIGNALQAAEEDLSGQFIAGATTPNIREDLQTGNCVIVYRGVFGETDPTGEDGLRGLTRKTLADLGLADYPAFYAEIKATQYQDSLRLEPKYIRYAATSAANPGSGKKHVGVVVAIIEKSLSSVDTRPTETDAVALFQLNLGKLTIGKNYLDRGQKFPILTGTGSLQSIDFDENAAANIVAYVIETEKPGLILKTFAETYAANEQNLSATLSKFIQDSLSPSDQGA